VPREGAENGTAQFPALSEENCCDSSGVVFPNFSGCPETALIQAQSESFTRLDREWSQSA
jgi:hypothetical protein